MRLASSIPLVTVALACLLVACGPAKKSVFPPTVTIQQMRAVPGKPWQLVLRVSNNSYSEMDFKSIDASLRIADLPAVPLSQAIDLDIPAIAADVINVQLTPSASMSAALAAVAVKGSAGSLSYAIDGAMTAKPEEEKIPRSFEFQAHDWLSPVPGIANTFR
jgi:hypothetical protein